MQSSGVYLVELRRADVGGGGFRLPLRTYINIFQNKKVGYSPVIVYLHTTRKVIFFFLLYRFLVF